MTVKTGLPGHFVRIRSRYGKFFEALEELGKSARLEGPLDGRTAHLVQLAAAAAIRSEGAVHSHTRRALDAGASPDEIFHTVILLTSTIGFPSVAAALSWVEDVIEKPEGKQEK
jgi:AhpD family alkylhydroperoxidase